MGFCLGENLCIPLCAKAKSQLIHRITERVRRTALHPYSIHSRRLTNQPLVDRLGLGRLFVPQLFGSVGIAHRQCHTRVFQGRFYFLRTRQRGNKTTVLFHDRLDPRLDLRPCKMHRLAIRRRWTCRNPKAPAINVDGDLVGKEVTHQRSRPIKSLGRLGVRLPVALELPPIVFEVAFFRP